LEIDVPDDADAASLRASEVELAPCLTSMIDRLSEPYRSAIQLTSIRGLTQADAAREAGVSVSGMKSRVQRGREQLRQMLVRCCEIQIDVRGGVADFHLKSPGACDAPSGAKRTCRSHQDE
jgi:RNA polymerase sigma-70 factor (ECF subfamily)